jgi:DNA-binding NarL/FixJ family response regulator
LQNRLFLTSFQSGFFAHIKPHWMQKEKLVVMVVDDSIPIAIRLTNILYGMESVGLVLHAPDYEKAMAMLSNCSIPFLLVDINLPGKNGIEILRSINKMGYKTKVMMISNQDNSYYRELCASLGACYYFDKSDDFDKIPFIISQLVLNEQASTENYYK